MQVTRRPLPVPNSLTKPFWDATKQHRLVIQRCPGCGTYYHPPVNECPKDLRRDLGYQDVSGQGTIYGFTLVHDTRLQGFEQTIPYPVVLVELLEQPGLIFIANMATTPYERLRIGATVKVVYQEIEGGFVLPEFELV